MIETQNNAEITLILDAHIENEHVRKVQSQAAVDAQDVQEIVDSASSGICAGVSPELCPDGTGGVYFMKNDKSEVCAVFKPRDEECMGPNNPRGYRNANAVVGVTESGMRRGFRVGDGALREVAAYALDHAYGGFSGVPRTSLVCLPVSLKEETAKEGSLQEFVHDAESCEDFGPSKFDSREVHKIALLDLRLFNTDRHAGNIMMAKNSSGNQTGGTHKLTPIDHGFCLPDWKHLGDASFEWLHWQQAKIPLTQEAVDLVASFDIERDAETLRALGIREECVTTMRISSLILKLGVEAGLTLFDIAQCVERSGDGSSPSALEECVSDAEKIVLESHPELASTNSADEMQFANELLLTLEGILFERIMMTRKPTKARSVSSAF